MLTILLQDNVEIQIPEGLKTFEQFQRWVRSTEFPKRGRIDFIRGNIEIDLAEDEEDPEAIITLRISKPTSENNDAEALTIHVARNCQPRFAFS